MLITLLQFQKVKKDIKTFHLHQHTSNLDEKWRKYVHLKIFEKIFFRKKKIFFQKKIVFQN